MNINSVSSSCGKLGLYPKSTIFSATGNHVLSAKYLKKDESGAPTEEPVEMFRRVAREIASVDASHEKGSGHLNALKKNSLNRCLSWSFFLILRH